MNASMSMVTRAGEFPKKIYAPGLKAGFWSKKCPQKAGEPYAQFSPSEIWVIANGWEDRAPGAQNPDFAPILRSA